MAASSVRLEPDPTRCRHLPFRVGERRNSGFLGNSAVKIGVDRSATVTDTWRSAVGFIILHGYKTEGMQQGEGILLRRLLTRRFGSLSEAIGARLSQASTDQLEIWGDRVLDAKSLDDVFQEH